MQSRTTTDPFIHLDLVNSGWRLDMDHSTSDVVYAWVHRSELDVARGLGWQPAGALVGDEIMMMFVKEDIWS